MESSPEIELLTSSSGSDSEYRVSPEAGGFAEDPDATTTESESEEIPLVDKRAQQKIAKQKIVRFVPDRSAGSSNPQTPRDPRLRPEAATTTTTATATATATTGSLQGQVGPSDQAEVNIEAGAQGGEGPAVAPGLDIFEGATIINDPVDSAASRLDDAALRRLCAKHQIPYNETRLPSRADRAHNPPEGFIACNRYMCTAGCVPPFSDFIRGILELLRLAPTQLHPNGYAFLLGTNIAFQRILGRAPTDDEIRHIYCFKKRRESPSLIYMEPSVHCRVVTGSWNKLSQFKAEWFYVRCPPGFARRWMTPGKQHFIKRYDSYIHNHIN